VPAIGGDCTAIAFGRRIHDREYHGAFFYAAEANRAHVGRH
jgi:plasmid stabilization system protein ParE